MAKVNLVEKQSKMNLAEIIFFQIKVHCHLKRLQVNDSDLRCLTLLCALKQSDLSDFCTLSVKKNIFKSTQTVRNCVSKLEKYNLITKFGKNKQKGITLNPDMQIQSSGNIVLNLKFFYIEPKENQGTN